jgi:hypothetical protein
MPVKLKGCLAGTKRRMSVALRRLAPAAQGRGHPGRIGEDNSGRIVSTPTASIAGHRPNVAGLVLPAVGSSTGARLVCYPAGD